MPLDRCKTWKESRVQIEHTLVKLKSTGLNKDISLKSGLQLRTSISHYPSPIFSTCYRSGQTRRNEFYLINYMSMDGGESIVVEWEYDVESHVLSARRKFKIRNCLKHLVWIANQRAFVGYCDDMTLRAYKGQNMEEKVRVSVSSSALYVLYLEDLDELVVAGQGHITTWRLHQIDFGLPFEWKDPQISCEIRDNLEIWITYLWYSRQTKTLLALSSEAVYFIDMKMRKQVSKMENSHQASLTSCAWYPRFTYMITAARDGTLHVYHTVTNAMVHQFPAHRDGITGVVCLPNQPILLSWSHTSGCLRLWRLDTFEMLDESALAEGLTALHLVRPDCLFYQTESEVRIFDVNILFTISTTLSAPAQSMKLCWIKAASIESFKARSKQVMKQPDIVHAFRKRKLPPDSSIFNSLVNTEPRSRLLCILEDGCIISVSPVTGSLVHIIYPPTGKESDKHPVNAAVNINGSASFLLLRNNEVVEYNSTVNPGQEIRTQQYLSNVTSIAALETTFSPDTGDTAADDHDAIVAMVLLGCETGMLKIHQDASFVVLGNGLRKPLTMEPVKIHAGAVTKIFVSSEMQALAAYVRGWVCLSFYGVFVTAGTNRLAFIWRTKFSNAKFGIGFQMTPVKLHKIILDQCPILVAGVGGVVMFTHRGGLISMWRITFQKDVKELLDDVLLTKRIPIDNESKHKADITSASGSEVLNIFLTCGYAELIKIWNSSGQLLRELNLGSDCFSACFSNGRDIAASYKRHIIVIEAHDYLPFELLEELLNFDQEFMIKDVPVEIPVSVEDGHGFRAVPVSSIHRVLGDSINMADGHSVLSSAEESKMVRSQRKKFNDLSFKKFHMHSSQQEKQLEQAESDSRIWEMVHHRSVLFHRPAPRVESGFLSDAIITKMKVWPVAPDCHIPNSVIRCFVEPIYSSFPRKKQPQCNILLSDILVGGMFESKCESSQSLTVVPSTCTVPLKIGNGVKMLKKLTSLEELLKCIREEKWCPNELRVETLESGLVALADVVDSAPSSVILKILAALLKIREECVIIKLPHAPSIGIPCQKAIARKLYSLLCHSRMELRETAACLLSKFDNQVIEGFREEFLVPRLKRVLEYSTSEGPPDDRDLMEYALCVVSVTKHVGTEFLASAQQQEKFAGNELTATERVRKVIKDGVTGWGVHPSTAEVWTRYIFGHTKHESEEIMTRDRQHTDGEIFPAGKHSATVAFTSESQDPVLWDASTDCRYDPTTTTVHLNTSVSNWESLATRNPMNGMDERGKLEANALLEKKSCSSNKSESMCWVARR